MLALLLLMLWSLLSGCDLGSVKNSKKDQNQNINLPSFAVEPFDYSSVSAPATLFVDAADCLDELKQLNTAGDNVHDALLEKDDAKPLALAMSADVYANTTFYDCNVREQFNQDGAKEIEDTSTHVLYHAGKVKDKVFEGTRFVAWKELKDNDGSVPKTSGEADNVEGTMINLYLFKEDGPQQTLVSLNKKDSLRQVGALFYVDAPQADVGVSIWSGHIVEYKSGTDKEHLLGMRLLHYSEEDKVFLLLAHYKADGAALLEAECEINDDEDYNKSCTDVKYKASYYNKATDKIEDDVPAGFKKTKEDFLTNLATNWAHGSYFADKLDPAAPFFAGTGTIDAKRKEFFTDNLPAQQPALTQSVNLRR